MRFTIQKIKVIVLILILFLIPGFVFAKDANQLQLPQTSVNPGSFYYPLKRLIEKGKERLMFSRDSKRSFYTSLLKTRLAELNFVANKKMMSEIQRSSERFAYQAGILAAIDEKGKASEKLIQEFEKYSRFLEGLRDQYPANSSFWMLIQHDINALSILSDQLK